MSIVGLPRDPGESVSSKIEPDVTWIEKLFKVKVTDGYSVGGPHTPNGEHPVGLAVDIIPDTARGGTWDDVDRLAGWAAKHPKIFRFVGYDGRFGTTAWPGHGRGNHLHLSWHGGPVEGTAAATPTIVTGSGKVGRPAWAFAEHAGDGSAVTTGVGGVINQAIGAAQDEVSAVGGAIDFATDPIGWLASKGAKPLLTIALVFAGLAIAALGVARMTGLRAPVPGAPL